MLAHMPELPPDIAKLIAADLEKMEEAARALDRSRRWFNLATVLLIACACVNLGALLARLLG